MQNAENFRLGSALGPGFGALAIGMQANGIFALHDLHSSASGRGDVAYSCGCGTCVKNLTYVIDRKETNAAILAIGIFTAGLAVVADHVCSMAKSFRKNCPKEQVCKSFVEGARGGCICAVAWIMMICGEWGWIPRSPPKRLPSFGRTTARCALRASGECSCPPPVEVFK